ncbi:MAG: NAD+ synthase [Candidatus Lokiarchaeota archaeon]|nr:NAD+ synthase [Candidatus Lokiarchaeota archaeon]
MRELDYEKLVIDIQNWIKNYVKSANATYIVVGLSGGIDSAVTITLCTKAIGKENIIGMGLPCESISQDLEDAKLIAKHLGINFDILDLTPVYDKFLDITSSIPRKDKLASANLKPRLRMMALYFIGQSKGKCLIAGTSNRAELVIGYFTKYGDSAADFEPIASLYKQEVRKVAEFLNIPERIITKAPSAGLWAGQTDEEEIGLSYDVIDEVLYRIDYNLDFKGINEDDIKTVKNLMNAAEHKLNMPPFFNVRESSR